MGKATDLWPRAPQTMSSPLPAQALDQAGADGDVLFSPTACPIGDRAGDASAVCRHVHEPAHVRLALDAVREVPGRAGSIFRLPRRASRRSPSPPATTSSCRRRIDRGCGSPRRRCRGVETPAQIALAWLLAQKPWIVPIPGNTKRHRLEENLGATNVVLTAEDLREIDAAAAQIEIQGARYAGALEKRTGL